MTIPRKSRSSKREYRLTQKGKEGGSKNGGTELGVPENVNISGCPSQFLKIITALNLIKLA
jgi:Ni,Fe-hydrogenase III small subunit